MGTLLTRLRRAVSLDRTPETWRDGPCVECGAYVPGYRGTRTKRGLFCSDDHALTTEQWDQGW